MKIKSYVLYDKINKDIVRVSIDFFLAFAMRAKPFGRLELRHATVTIGKKVEKKNARKNNSKNK